MAKQMQLNLFPHEFTTPSLSNSLLAGSDPVLSLKNIYLF